MRGGHWFKSAKVHKGGGGQTAQTRAEPSTPKGQPGLVAHIDQWRIVTIKSGKRKPKVKVPAARITDGSFQIGKYTQIRATKTFLHDKVGLTGGESYEFVAFAFSGDDTPLIDVGD